MKYLSITFMFFFMLSCAGVKVDYDYDSTADFSNYKSYQYYGNMETGLSEFDTKRLMDAIDMKLSQKGFIISETPDFYIDIKSRAYQDAQRSSVGIGLGGGGGNVGGGVSVGIPVGEGNIMREIVIDFVDENKKQLFWQAISESQVNSNGTPEQHQEQMTTIVDKVFEQYPPESK